jgi:hypothetical protein
LLRTSRNEMQERPSSLVPLDSMSPRPPEPRLCSRCRIVFRGDGLDADAISRWFCRSCRTALFGDASGRRQAGRAGLKQTHVQARRLCDDPLPCNETRRRQHGYQLRCKEASGHDGQHRWSPELLE